MTDYKRIIDFLFPEEANAPLRHILLVHSTSVADKAVKIVEAHPELQVDRDFVYAAAMLHDIGIVRCHAPSIHCFGTEPYICHGMVGARLLHRYDFGLTGEEKEKFSRVCARHTGTGLTKEQIVSQGLPLPPEDLVPETEEEKIICYADKFFSKTHLDHEKTFEEAQHSLMKFGEAGVEIFNQWHNRYFFEGSPIPQRNQTEEL